MGAEELRVAMDGDKAFQSKRKALVFVSLLLLAIVVSGAQIKEANTFIFKIDFTNHEGLKYLLVVAVLACLLRYCSYSEKYHSELFKIWSSRLLKDFDVYYLDEEAGVVVGVLGGKIDMYDDGGYDLENPVYHRTGFLKRSIGLHVVKQHDFYGAVYSTTYFSLNEYSGSWRPSDFRFLLLREFKFRVEAWFKYRETLDLVSPYLVGWSSLLVFLCALAFAG